MKNNQSDRYNSSSNKKHFGDKLRLLFMLSASTLIMMIILGIGSYLQAQWFTSPAHVMKGLSSSVSSQFFADMLAMEVQQLQKSEESFTFSKRNTANFLLRFLLNINPLDPKTLLASEIPGIENEKLVLLRPGLDDEAVPPRDYTPPLHTYEPGEDKLSNDQDGFGSWTDQLAVDFSLLADVVDNSKIPLLQLGAPNQEQGPVSEGRKKVFIYHSHPRESFLPELKPGLKFEDAHDAETNVTLLGARLAEKLNDLGIGTTSAATDYPTTVKGYDWNYSYKYSLETVKEAFATNPSLEYYFDIHRDSGARKTTTENINGIDYARVYFIIGHKNPNWQKNEALASKIHEKLEAAYPGISRGIWGKQAGSGNNGEYNQSFSPNSIVIEVGGVENTLEETYRTIDALAKIISDIVMDAVKVDQPKQNAQTKA